MEQINMQSNTLVGDVNVGCPTLEAVTNHLVGAVDVTPFDFGCRYWRLNTKINSMLSNHVIADTDVRDLAYLMEELGMRHQWKEMNAKIRAELEGISKNVEAATKILDENPPPVTALPVVPAVPAYRYWQNRWFTGPRHFGFRESMFVPQVVAAPVVAVPEVFTSVQPCVVKMEQPKRVMKLSVSELPWQQWHCKMNNEVANAQVGEIIPVRPQKVERRLFGEWDALMEDVLDWHRFGLHRYRLRLTWEDMGAVQSCSKQ